MKTSTLKSKLILTWWLTFFIGPLPLFARYAFTPEVHSAYKDFIALKTESGKLSIDLALAEDPKNGLAVCIADYHDLVVLLTSQDPALYKKLEPNAEKRLDKIASLEKDSPFYRYCQAEIKLHWAFIKLSFGDQFQGGIMLRQAFKLLEENEKLYPNFTPNKKSFGTLKILIGSIPPDYQWVAKQLGLYGTVHEGMNMVNEVAQSDSPLAMEAKLISLMVQSLYFRDKTALESIQSLFKTHPNNLLLCYLEAQLELKNNKAEKAIQTLNNQPKGTEYAQFPYLKFLLGEAYLFKGEYALSQQYFQQFTKNYKGVNHLKSAYFRSYLSYWLQGNSVEAEKFKKLTKEKGGTQIDSDQYAQRFVDQKSMPDKNLMKARLFFDGGYFDKALAVLNSKEKSAYPSHNEQQEYLYRKARIYHETGKVQLALSTYQEVIDHHRQKDDSYFAPNSALQMGYIYRDQGSKEKARLAFQKARSFPKHEYQNSIHSEAKSAEQALN